VKIDELLESFIGIRDPELGMLLIPRFILKHWILVSCESF